MQLSIREWAGMSTGTDITTRGSMAYQKQENEKKWGHVYICVYPLCRAQRQRLVLYIAKILVGKAREYGRGRLLTSTAPQSSNDIRTNMRQVANDIERTEKDYCTDEISQNLQLFAYCTSDIRHTEDWTTGRRNYNRNGPFLIALFYIYIVYRVIPLASAVGSLYETNEQFEERDGKTAKNRR
jgi:hypothetical protein